MSEILLSFILGFIFGIIPFSYILGRIKKIDLRNVGSKNIGATNLGRALGPKYFLLGFLLDGLKGAIPVLIATNFNLLPAVSGIGAILGHIFNPLFNFKGGKGVSTTIGVTSGIVPLPFLMSIGVWLFFYFTTNIVSLASISFSIMLIITTLFLSKIQLAEKVLILIISLLIIFAHRSNIKRLITKTEPKTILWRRR